MDNNFAQVNVHIAVRAGLFGDLPMAWHGHQSNLYAGLACDADLERARQGIPALSEYDLDAVLRARFGRAQIGPNEVCWNRAVVYVTDREGNELFPKAFEAILRASPAAMAAIAAKAEETPAKYAVHTAWMMEDWALQS